MGPNLFRKTGISAKIEGLVEKDHYLKFRIKRKSPYENKSVN